jgi:hypothetical protein
MEQSLQPISDFLSRYKSFTLEKANLRFDEFIFRFNHIKTALETINSISKELNEHFANDFNIFCLLGVEKKEDKTHTAFIANLLDPEGSHAQGYLFLESFIKYCNNKDQSFPKVISNIENYQWFVETWKYTSNGIPDIVISSPDLEYLVVIENKIDAQETGNQLKRYLDWMGKKKDRYKNQSLIFLNPRGYPSVKEAMDGQKYLILSYEDIYNWLNSSSDHVKAPRVKEIITQYLDVIQTFKRGL